MSGKRGGNDPTPAAPQPQRERKPIKTVNGEKLRAKELKLLTFSFKLL